MEQIKKDDFISRLQRMPVPVLPTFVGALTLGNVYGGLGYTLVRYLTMIAGTIVLILYIIKMVKYTDTCLKEYSNVVPASLYAGFTMMIMILGAFYGEKVPIIGKVCVLAAVFVHAAHILIFTFRNVIAKRDIKTFVPSWFVTYNGIMVSCVVGAGMNIKPVLRIVMYYGIIVYFVIVPSMIWRLLTVEVQDAVYHTMAVLLAPCSLCLVSYLNISDAPKAFMVYLLYFCVLASLTFIIIKLPKFFAYSFTPGFAGLTFPMCIGIVASNKMSAYLANTGKEGLSAIVSQLAGVQIYITTMLVAFVLLNFLIMALRVPRKG